MKTFFLFCFVLGLTGLQTDHILWSENNLLTWDDFKGKPNTSSPYKALTECSILFDIKTKGKEATLTIQNYFERSASWVKEKADALLIHEQMHFNIAEIWARKFRMKLNGKTFDPKTFQKELTALHAEIFKDSKKMQNDYDTDTEHSVNEKEQKIWNEKIRRLLLEFSAYTSTQVNCKLK